VLSVEVTLNPTCTGDRKRPTTRWRLTHLGVGPEGTGEDTGAATIAMSPTKLCRRIGQCRRDTEILRGLEAMFRLKLGWGLVGRLVALESRSTRELNSTVTEREEVENAGTFQTLKVTVTP